MTKDLISRSALLAEYDRVHVGPPGGARRLIQEAPAVEAVPVVNGRWVNTKNEVEQMCKCSACGYPVSYFWTQTPFCPNCGAKMEDKL